MSFILETKSLTKKFGDFVALDRVDVKIRKNTIHAILGENGAGKSTLLKTLFGIHNPTSGEILLRGVQSQIHNPIHAIRAGIGMVQQHFTLVDDLSVIDNITLGSEVQSGLFLDRAQAISNLEKLIATDDLRLDWQAHVRDLAIGQKQKVEILKLLFRESAVLFLDEPTAVLTPSEIERFLTLLTDLKKSGKTIVLITHKLAEIKKICDDYTVLRSGRVTGSGEVSSATQDQLIEMMIGRKPVPLTQIESQIGDVILRCENISENSAERGSLKGVNLEVRSGEIVGVAGVDGSGQSKLVEAIIGSVKVESGFVSICQEKVEFENVAKVRALGVGLIPEDRLGEGLWPSASCRDNYAIGIEEKFFKSGVKDNKKLRAVAEEWSSSFDVRYAHSGVAAGSLSGGNQQKLILAREILGRNLKLLISHHPTRGIDHGAIELVHARLIELKSKGVGILVLSSDLDELFALSDRIVVLHEGKSVGEFKRPQFSAQLIGQAMLGATI